jgi:heat shock protein HtpX
MAMDFWESQRQSKFKTTIYLSIFFALTIAASILAEIAMRLFDPENYGNSQIPYVALGFLTLTFCVAGFNYLQYISGGGSYVAESVGAQQVNYLTRDPKERQLLNIVEEIALATSLPVPPVYILEVQEINAFAAGTTPQNAAITVTRGCLNLLNRDELQGVLAHEFGHVYNRDMTIGMRVAAMIMGFFIVSYLGIRLLQNAAYTSGGYSRRDEDDNRGGNPILLLALIFIVIGSVTWFFGSILQGMVSRQREYLADASAVQYTRNPEGIANALRKILHSSVSDMPKSGQPFAHLYFNEPGSFWSRLFATHPPLEERIAAIEGRPFEDKKLNLKEPPLFSSRSSSPPPFKK